MADLPTPRTVTDQLLLAMVDELRGLRADLARALRPSAEEPATSGEVDLVEPARPKPRRRARKG